MTDDGIRYAWLNPETFPRPCDFCGEPIHPQHVYRFEGARYRCERCLCKSGALKIEWGLKINTYTRTGEKDSWIPIGKDDATLEACYARALKQDGNFDLMKWYKRSLGQHGTPVYRGWADKLPPIEEIQAEADGTRKPKPLVWWPCAVCGELTGILCACGKYVCWDHRKGGRQAHAC